MSARSVPARHPVAVGYLALLLLSAAFTRLAPGSPDPLRCELRRADLGSPAGERFHIVWREAGQGSGTPVLLLHGSPGDGAALLPLAQEIAAERRVLLPDLPGFGGSSRAAGDLSFARQAERLRAWLDAIGEPAVDLVAVGLGAGPALHLAAADSGRLRSLTLLSAVGVQELSLLGDHRLNHGLFRLQAAAVWALHRLVPHFGLLDRAPFDRAFARSWLAADQRPLRGLLLAWGGPALVVHGTDDVLVPAATARESHRLLPQAELRLLPGGHAVVRSAPREAGRAIREFLRGVDRGAAPGRAEAAPERIAAAAADPARLPPPRLGGLSALLLCLLLAVGTFVSEDLACVGAGLLVARGSLGFAAATAACLAGIFVGDLLLYAAGRRFGRIAVRRAPLRWFVSEPALRRAARWFVEEGPRVILVSRFTPGTRSATYLAAGLLQVPGRRFARWLLVAAALWTPLLVGVSAVAGRGLLAFLWRLPHAPFWLLLLVPALLWLLAGVISGLVTWRGRRLLLSRWRRLRHWEFWPLWLVQLPIVLWVLALGLRHRCLTLFTAANPGIPDGGFVGESKAAILGALASDPEGEAAASVARFAFLPAGEDPAARRERLRAAITDLGLAYPVVLKPDVGERGRGVAVVRSEEEATRYLAGTPRALLVQEHVPGEEYGVFYARPPGSPHGEVLSITAKEFPQVTGDGRRTLEELLLADDRAVAMARFFLDLHVDRLDEVPAPGERIALTEIGNHCRGTVFRDGTRLRTPELAAALDRMVAGFAGFSFGRFDLRAPTAAALRAGGPFRVLELNGVSSEMTHIYDPQAGLVAAWRTLAGQWRLAFAIGAVQRARGARPTPPGELLAKIWRHRLAPVASAPSPAR
ncbi:MAG: alpha/beta fold hydrolase [Thermoanaerobaculia bacterium]|nr:alpha/beta fold hydrolase [Thermoanaerobaculia bacterium]